jgi:hypothetical protein
MIPAEALELQAHAILSLGDVMRLVFIGIDPATNGLNCPAVFADADTGDLLLQGWTVTDPQVLAETAAHSPLGSAESVVRLPARMKAMIMEAASGGADAPVHRADHRRDSVGGAPGDAGRLHPE